MGNIVACGSFVIQVVVAKVSHALCAYPRAFAQVPHSTSAQLLCQPGLAHELHPPAAARLGLIIPSHPSAYRPFLPLEGELGIP